MKIQYYTKKDVGTKRTREVFLWFPLEFTGDWRWLEKARIKESIHEVDVGGSMEWGNFVYCWCIDGWVK